METANGHEMITEAWAEILQLVDSKKLDPLVVSMQLRLFASQKGEQMFQALQGLVAETEKYLAHMKVSVEHLRNGLKLLHCPHDLLEKHVGDMKFSVRARKAFIKLGINTVGELIDTNADTLLECKNFGTTTLQEVRAKLFQVGLKLKRD